MSQLNSFEIGLLAEELRAKAVNSFVKNVYETGPKALVLKVFKAGVGAGEIWLVAGYSVFYTEKTVGKQLEPPKHVLELRKLVVGRKILNVEQISGERIVSLRFGDGDLVVECIPPGNIIFVRDGKIEWLLEKYESSTRVLKIGGTYKPPPFKPSLKAEEADVKVFDKIEPKTNIVTALSRDLGLGGKFAEEIIHRAKVDKKKKITQLSEDEKIRLLETAKNLLMELRMPKPRIYRGEDGVVPSAFEMESFAGKESVSTETLGEAALLAYLENLELSRRRSQEAEANKIAESLRKERDSRLYVLQQLEKRKREAEAFLEKVNTALSFWQSFWTDPVKACEDAKSATGLTTEFVDGCVELRDGELRVSFRQDTSPMKELGKLYEEIKSTRKAIEKLEAEIADLDQRIAKAAAVTPSQLTSVVLKTVAKKTKPYREFVTSGGFHVLMGKDARTNISLLKKNLHSNDLVFHTEIAGSPVTVLRNGQSASASDIEEAAQATACYSRAWRENFSNVSVYYVKPEQVSFSPPPGQFLPKGSFMVYGKREYIVPELRLAAALSDSEVTVMPALTAVRLGKRFVEIRPGTVNAFEAAVRILELLEVEVNPENRENLAKNIPYGKCVVSDKAY